MKKINSKNLIRVIALFETLLLVLFTLCSCKEKATEMTSSETTKSLIEETATQAKTTEHTTAKPVTTDIEKVQSVWLEPTADEWNDLDNYLSVFTLNSINDFSFNSEEKNADKQIYDMIVNMNISGSIYGKFFKEDYVEYDVWQNEENLPDQNIHDPLGLLQGYYHYKIPAKNIDWIITNIFNLTPNHDIKSRNPYGNFYYYHGDYFYSSGGDGADYPAIQKTIKKTKLSNGMYDISTLGSFEDDGDYFDKFDLTAGIKEVDGKRFWSFTKIKYTNIK